MEDFDRMNKKESSTIFKLAKSRPNKQIEKSTYISYDLEVVSIHIIENSGARRDVEIMESISDEESKFGSNCSITDIKQITHKLRNIEILKLINDELEISNNSNMNPFNLQQEADKLLINKLSDLQHLEDVGKTFVHRKVNCKLTPSQIKFIALQIHESGLTIPQLSRKYCVSRQLIYRVKAMKAADLERRIYQPANKVLGAEEQWVIQCIKRFARNRSFPYIVEDVRNYVYQNMGRYYDYKIIYKMMKEEANLSYKKWKPRPNSIDLEATFMKRRLFWIKLAKMLKEETLIANTDESTIGHNSQIFYSWSPKRVPTEFKNQPFVGSINIVLTILNNGAWFWFLSNQTINSDRFSDYISKFNEWIANRGTFGFRNLIILLDNWSSHRSKKCMKLFKTMDHHIVFNPQYSPQLAPIEMWFSYIKQQLKRRMKYQTLNLSNRFSQNTMLDTLKDLNKIIVRNCFKEFYAEVKRNLEF